MRLKKVRWVGLLVAAFTGLVLTGCNNSNSDNGTDVATISLASFAADGDVMKEVIAAFESKMNSSSLPLPIKVFPKRWKNWRARFDKAE